MYYAVLDVCCVDYSIIYMYIKLQKAVSSCSEHSNIAAAIQIQRFWRGHRTRLKLQSSHLTNSYLTIILVGTFSIKVNDLIYFGIGASFKPSLDDITFLRSKLSPLTQVVTPLARRRYIILKPWNPSCFVIDRSIDCLIV